MHLCGQWQQALQAAALNLKTVADRTVLRATRTEEAMETYFYVAASNI